MTYRFTLAPVLKLRQSIEERGLHLLEQTQHEIAHTVQMLETLRRQADSEMAQREQALESGVAAAALHFSEQLRRGLGEQVRALEKKLAELQIRREQQLKGYEDAKRERQVLSDLRNRQQEAYEARADYQRQRLTDDSFLARRKPG